MPQKNVALLAKKINQQGSATNYLCSSLLQRTSCNSSASQKSLLHENTIKTLCKLIYLSSHPQPVGRRLSFQFISNIVYIFFNGFNVSPPKLLKPEKFLSVSAAIVKILRNEFGLWRGDYNV